MIVISDGIYMYFELPEVRKFGKWRHNDAIFENTKREAGKLLHVSMYYI